VSISEQRADRSADGFALLAGGMMTVRVAASTSRLAATRSPARTGICIRHTSEPTSGRDTMLIDEILRALRDPEYQAQLIAEARGALPDNRTWAPVDGAEIDEEPAGES
jgi:hypothetical protein